MEQKLLFCVNEKCFSNQERIAVQVLINGNMRIPLDDNCQLCGELMEEI
jgi:aspartate carbamoyltransferase regulatory subunit